MLAPAVMSWFTRILDVCHPATIAANIVQTAEVKRVTGVGPAWSPLTDPRSPTASQEADTDQTPRWRALSYHTAGFSLSPQIKKFS